jgi:hypothetical protein
VTDITHLTVRELISLQAKVADELRNRKITRSSNQLTGDLAEYLFCKAFKAFGWTQSENSNPSFDAIDSDKRRYQIKGRRLTHNKSRQLGAIRGLHKSNFDFLAAVLFDENYSVYLAAIIPHEVVVQRAIRQEHTNSHIFMLRDDVLKAPGVRDVTQNLREVLL